MRLQTAIILLAAVVIASGCGGTGSPDVTEPTAESPDTNQPVDSDNPDGSTDVPESVNVEYTSSGFDPAIVRVQQGGTVTWVDNNSNTGMWVGSNRHPTHTQYDGTSTSQHCSGGSSNTFDQCSTGDRYSFTFDKTGEWNYHNHRQASHGGTVVVE